MDKQDKNKTESGFSEVDNRLCDLFGWVSD